MRRVRGFRLWWQALRGRLKGCVMAEVLVEESELQARDIALGCSKIKSALGHVQGTSAI